MPITTDVMILGAVNLLMFPMFLFLLKRALGKMLDGFDAKRDEARIEQEQYHNRREQEYDAIRKGIRSLLRTELIHENRKWVKLSYCPLASKEYVQRTYEAYHALGGNDVGTAMYEEIMNLPTE
jgi:hypothetical protein